MVPATFGRALARSQMLLKMLAEDNGIGHEGNGRNWWRLAAQKYAKGLKGDKKNKSIVFGDELVNVRARAWDSFPRLFPLIA